MQLSGMLYGSKLLRFVGFPSSEVLGPEATEREIGALHAAAALFHHYGQKIIVTCTCGQIAHFLPGVLQRLHKLPSDTLVYDLRYRLRCAKCRSRERFTVTIAEDKWPPA
jgi:hypothetical protein